jgi:hypothetical protein
MKFYPTFIFRDLLIIEIHDGKQESLIAVMMKPLNNTFITSAHNVDEKDITLTRQIISLYSARNGCLNLLSLVKIISNTSRRDQFQLAGVMGVGSNPARPWQEIAIDCSHSENTCQKSHQRRLEYYYLIKNCSHKPVPVGASTWSLNLPLNRREETAARSTGSKYSNLTITFSSPTLVTLVFGNLAQ